jgi:tRNA-modifying protein YgfZ
MRDNPPVAEALFSGLPDHRILAMEGRDAAAFAQAQFMSDVANLADGHWQWSGWLTPKGRVIALFALLKFDPQTLWLLLPDADPPELAAALQRFVFRSKVSLAPRGDLQVAGSFDAPAAAQEARIAGDRSDAVYLDWGAGSLTRTLRISAAAHASTTTGADAVDRWKALDLACGLPRLPASQGGQWTPQQLSLDRLRAYSVRKGCYPGQEIVARTHFLGQAKRGLALFEASAAVPVGADVVDDGRAIGTVVSSATHGDGSLVLAVLPLDIDTAHLRADSLVLAPRPLLDGLAR